MTRPARIAVEQGGDRPPVRSSHPGATGVATTAGKSAHAASHAGEAVPAVFAAPAARTRRRAAPFALRPAPPAELCEPASGEDARFAPAPDVLAWIRRVFVESVHESPLYNPEHAHLAMAQLLVLWTNAPNSRRGRVVLGTAEIPSLKGDAWQRARQAMQLREWSAACGFLTPDFVITLSAPDAAVASDAQFCALVEHELLHCGQARDEFGSPRFSRETGLPVWALRPHDVEEFVCVVRRYGKDATGVRALVEAAAQHEREPVFAADALAGVCGACG